ncbi:MAG: hypothetical protein WAV73_03445 [Candidatus Moraniibacteriota bacterium]
MVVFCSYDVFAKSEIVSSINLVNKIQDIVVDGNGMIYVTTDYSDNAWDGDVFKLQLAGSQLQKVSSLRGNGFRNWDAFNKMAILNGKGYALSTYSESCGIVADLNAMTIAVPIGMECQLKNSAIIIADDVNINIGGGMFSGGKTVPYVRSYVPLSNGELNYQSAVTPEGIPEKVFFQPEKKYLFMAMGNAGMGVWDTTDPRALWKLGQPRDTFYAADGYDYFKKAIDMVAENQYVYALAGDDYGWRGVLAIISLTEPNYDSYWFRFANQVGGLDINDEPLFLKKSGNRIYVATKESGILVVDVSDATKPKLVETIPIIAQDIEIVGDKLIVASGNLLQVIRLAGEKVVGDISGDGKVDLADAILALQVTSGKSVTVKVENGINGKIGLAEAVHALQKTAGLR